MKPKSKDGNSWKVFWLVHGFATPFLGLLITLSAWRLPEPQPPFDRALILGLLAACGALGANLIHRVITGRNTAIGFILVLSSFGLPRMASLSGGDIVRRHGILLLFLMLLVGLSALIQRAWTLRKSRPQSSPMADAEIDARPVA